VAKKKQFSWSGDEAQLLLNITLEYKLENVAEGVDWESIRSKYEEIWKRFTAQLKSMIENRSIGDFPHMPESITKAMAWPSPSDTLQRTAGRNLGQIYESPSSTKEGSTLSCDCCESELAQTN
jgi:hypothetical protein